MRENKKHGFSETLAWRYEIVMGTVVVLLCCCHAETGLYKEITEEFIPSLKKQKSIDLPNFGSCPDGWSEDEFDAGEGYRIPYCRPLNLSEFNPDSPLAPLPPNFLPCPSGWTEVEDVTTGLVTCHPYLWSRWSRGLQWS